MPSEDRKKNRVTLLDVARHAGVSRATASLVIRKSPLVGAETRMRVEEAMRELGYVYNMGAARLRAERSHTVGVIVPNLTNPFFAELLSGIEAVVDSAGMVVIVANSGDSVERQDRLMRRMREHGVDGVILCAAAGTGPGFLHQLTEHSLPLVQVLRHISDDIDYAGVDYAGGMRQAVDHLASLGHRAIAFAVHGPVHSAYRERVEGFRDAMRSCGLNPDMIVRLPNQIREIAAAAHLLFDGAKQPTAVVCFNDVIALGLAAGLYDRGLRVGENFSLVGFDDVTDAEAMRPRLTSVFTAPVAIGENAARLLLDRLADPSCQPRRVVKEPQLHIRQSCGPVAAPVS
ncbi:LacI family DNA-binding transcriptional regulator [Neorhizobium sp. P12A]|uniref:LacI family DNA-binding transcriptional regulator n=1 Tax=Neorhizobium sp. P12A TaxID=2268027 RepID=UPI0011EF6D1A|nr:LacI family DNA-binding transcriptional regulator [Neorhizobium sp. P12A]KAA0697164.1 LacI family DNA-binding transcriptional regulator [Neorhizobium sp. P12A]